MMKYAIVALVVMGLLIFSSIGICEINKTNLSGLIIDVIKTFGGSGNDNGNVMVYTSNGTIVGGFCNEMNSKDQSAYLCFLDNSYKLVWQKSWINGTFGRIVGLVLDNSGNIFCAYETDGANAVVEFSDTGNLLQWKTFPTQDIWSMCIGGNNIFISGINGDNAYIAKLDLNDTIVWQRNWSIGTTATFANSLISNDNKTLYVVGTNYEPFVDSTDAILVAFSTSNGTELWNKTWGIPNKIDNSIGLASDKYNNIYISGGLDDCRKTYTRKCDVLGNLLWEKQWWDIGITYGDTVIINGTNVLVGGLSDIQAMVLEYDTNGMYLDGYVLKDYSLSSLSDLSIAKNGTIYGTGSVINGTTNTDIALFKISPVVVPEFAFIMVPITLIALFLVADSTKKKKILRDIW